MSSSRSFAAVLLPAALLLASCGPAPAPETPGPEAAAPPAGSAQTAPAAAPGSSPEPADHVEMTALTDETIRANAAHFDPSLSGWDTETFHDWAKHRFKEIGHHFEENHLDAKTLRPYVVDGAPIAELRPAGLPAVRELPPATVRRAGEAVEPAGTGAEGLAAALRGLRAPYEGLADPHPNWKIIKVSLDGSTGYTFVRVETSAHDDERALQQVTHWRVDWRLEPEAGEESLRISKLEREALDEVEITAKGGHLLSDATRAVIDADELWQELKPGVSELWGRSETALGIHAYGHHGLAVGDPNGDGLEDVYLIEPGGRPNRLLLQQPDGTVREAEGSGAGVLDWSLAALFLDADGDGDEDLAVSTDAGVVLLANDGAARFTRRAVIGSPAQPGHLSAADFDGDGDLDLHVCRYAPFVSAELGRRTLPVPYHDAENGATNLLLRNDGDFVFTDVADLVGLGENGTRFSFAAAWEDFDDDGDQDLYVANDFGRNNLYRNDGGVFTDVAPELGVEDISAGMGVAWGDVNGDARPDLHVSNMFSSAGNRITYQRRFRTGGDEQAIQAMQRHARGNSLFLNQGEAGFEDVSVESGITMGRWAWSASFADLDLDGCQDLLVSNGFVTNDDSKDL